MLDEVDAQYERIVRLIPVDELQSSYNSVQLDGINSVDRAVDGVVAALSRLKEVRNANQVSQDKPQRSRSLTKTMDRTLEVQQELEVKLQMMTILMRATSTNKKRQRSGQVTRTANTQRDSDESETESSSKSSSDSSDSDSESSSESEDEAIALDPRRQFLLHHSKPSAVITSVKLPPIVKTVSRNDELPAYYTTMFNNVKQVPMERRAVCISRALYQLKRVMTTDDVGEHKQTIPDSITEVLGWITESCDLQHDFESYHEFAIVLFSYAAQYPETEELQRITDRFSETIDKICLEATFIHADWSLEAQKMSAPTRTCTAEGNDSDTKTGEAFVSCASGKEKPTQYESEVDSESDSESDYEDEKETVGGSEAVECAYSFGYF
ncbi:hypothetical protein PInf_007854 [Phytophthora infestans]|nr:hypothetical protein PInf_007854 [Phytophthora infestans]